MKGNNVKGALSLKNLWPSVASTICADHKRYLETYMTPYPGLFYTGNGAARDEHGYI
jgi:acetyl-CoA synthetase